MKTREPQFGNERSSRVAPAKPGYDWSRVGCVKFNPFEDIPMSLCLIRAEEIPDIGLVDCRDCGNYPEDLS